MLLIDPQRLLTVAALLLMSAMAISCSSAQKDFSYDGEDGPAFWPKIYHSCGDPYQSPIALDTHTVQEQSDARSLRWKSWERRPSKQRLLNNGYTAVMLADWHEGGDRPVVWFGDEDERYTFGLLVFHWGENYNSGSEHTLNGMRYAMEMQVVLYSTQYDDLDSALEKPGATLLLAYLFQEDEAYQATALERALWQPLNFIRTPGTSIRIRRRVPLSALVPTFAVGYLRYNGSLTAPPCTRVRATLVDLMVHEVSSEQMESFRKMRNKKGEYITHNVRPLQPLNGRKVYVEV